MRNFINRFAKDESGATAIEYGLIAALISVVIIGALMTIGPKVKGMFDKVDAELPAAPAPK
ncbi:pilus assembly protein [Brevundimonas naejangsanensis]|uniref:Pilus assembly protein n=1 Tax=Brevundimonas naejangsanensis TaxID=588932 RepID=A0A172Y920_9CAUL|nr:Flp family type IVb pilin [Brevundimonas naejangsanensis]ANF55642.1 pilus assembly protein [Brevundimonas naejangsanensis]